jgi:hypothetical protein
MGMAESVDLDIVLKISLLLGTVLETVYSQKETHLKFPCDGYSGPPN